MHECSLHKVRTYGMSEYHKAGKDQFACPAVLYLGDKSRRIFSPFAHCPHYASWVVSQSVTMHWNLITDLDLFYPFLNGLRIE